MSITSLCPHSSVCSTKEKHGVGGNTGVVSFQQLLEQIPSQLANRRMSRHADTRYTLINGGGAAAPASRGADRPRGGSAIMKRRKNVDHIRPKPTSARRLIKTCPCCVMRLRSAAAA